MRKMSVSVRPTRDSYNTTIPEVEIILSSIPRDSLTLVLQSTDQTLEIIGDDLDAFLLWIQFPMGRLNLDANTHVTCLADPDPTFAGLQFEFPGTSPLGGERIIIFPSETLDLFQNFWK